MRNCFVQAALTLTFAISIAACAGGTSKAGDERAEHEGGARGSTRRVALTGCVQASPDGSGYLLSQISAEPAQGQPSGYATDMPLSVSAGVRLTGGENLSGYAGKRVALTGDMHIEPTATAGQVVESNAPVPEPTVAVENVKTAPGSCGGNKQ
jgi:hypothetical protein